MGSDIAVRSFAVPVSADKNVDIKISEPALRSENLTLTTWTSSFILAGLLHKLNLEFEDSAGIEVLELGAGTGLVGLTAGILWQKSVILTDLKPIVPGIEANVSLNESLIRKGTGSAQCGTLDWSQPSTLVLQSGKSLLAARHKASVILAADTVYSEELPELLSKAILTWLSPGVKSRAIITYPLRVAHLDYIRELWELLEKGGLEAMSEGRERGKEEDWDDEMLCEWSVWKWKES